MGYGERLLDSLSARIVEITEKACRLPFLGVFVRAALREQRHLAKDMSASIAALGLEWSLDSYLSPLRNFALTLTVSILVLVTIALAPVVEIITEFLFGFIGRRANSFVDIIAGQTIGFVISGSLLSAIYWLVPYQRLPSRDLLPGILVAATSLEIAKRFSWCTWEISLDTTRSLAPSRPSSFCSYGSTSPPE